MRIEITKIIKPDLEGDGHVQVKVDASDVQITRDKATVTLNHREMDELMDACKKFKELLKVIE